MTVLGLDDTDSATRGMCTTYVAAKIAERLPGACRTFLIRLNPAIEYKTRGNGAVAITTDTGLDEAFAIGEEVLEEFAITTDPATNPGLVGVASPAQRPDALHQYAIEAVRDVHPLSSVTEQVPRLVDRSRGWGDRRGLIGATAAIGAANVYEASARGCPKDGVFADWTVELIAYREPQRWGSDRLIEPESLAAGLTPEDGTVWDNIDAQSGELVCLPNSPCPVLVGLRGDDPNTLRTVLAQLEGESIANDRLFLTNQGTDVHLRPGVPGRLREQRAYRLAGTVASSPETLEGGHVRVSLVVGERRLRCFAFEPTKRFRSSVRALRAGDRVLVCGGFNNGALNLEKFAVLELRRTERVVPECSDCGKRMESAGRGQGYRCKECPTRRPSRTRQPIQRELDIGWYEVPPDARRHLAKPLVRGMPYGPQ